MLSSILSGSSCKSDIKGMESVMESILGLREKERFILPGFWVCPSSLLFFFLLLNTECLQIQVQNNWNYSCGKRKIKKTALKTLTLKERKPTFLFLKYWYLFAFPFKLLFILMYPIFLL